MSPLVGLRCRGCGGLPVGFDHFETTPCGETTCDPRLVKAAVTHERGRYSYGKPTVTVTQVLGCPRAGAIQASEPWSLDVSAINAALTGVAWGEWLDTHGELDSDIIKPTLEGEIEIDAGGGDGCYVTVTGEPDFLRPAQLLIGDDKHQNDFGRAEVEKNGPKPEHMAQVSLYGELARQQHEVTYSYGLLCYHWTLGTKNIKFDLWPLAQILEFRPHGGPTTVRENLLNSQKPWREQPLVGEQIQWKSGKLMCDGCQVKDICWTAAKGATF